ncbi:MAG: nucleotidyltransferase domain-containing protein, partial [Selenomonas sp.]|nr:nucleotidyltransferase domain-containing protein [Selenomonas sp.]
MFNSGDIIGGHTICLKALVGSHNYNLDTPESDKDYKYFVWPTFDDLYDNEMYHKEVVTDAEDYTVHDIRKLPMLLWKANLNFIEILYSKELTGDSDLLEYLEENKEELATMNLPGLYMAAMIMSIDKEKTMTKDSPARRDAIEKYGYDPKSACHALRVLDFLAKYCKTQDMAKAFWYPDGSYEQ